MGSCATQPAARIASGELAEESSEPSCEHSLPFWTASVKAPLFLWLAGFSACCIGAFKMSSEPSRESSMFFQAAPL